MRIQAAVAAAMVSSSGTGSVPPGTLRQAGSPAGASGRGSGGRLQACSGRLVSSAWAVLQVCHQAAGTGAAGTVKPSAAGLAHGKGVPVYPLLVAQQVAAVEGRLAEGSRQGEPTRTRYAQEAKKYICSAAAC